MDLVLLDAPVGLAPVNDPGWVNRLSNDQYFELNSHGTVTVAGLSVTPGVVDMDAEELYTGGQCVALAGELARLTGGQIVVRSTTVDRGPQRAAGRNVVHAYCLTPDGVLLDITGEGGDMEDLRRLQASEAGWYDDDTPLEPEIFENVEDAKFALRNQIEEQDSVVAESFAHAILNDR